MTMLKAIHKWLRLSVARVYQFHRVYAVPKQHVPFKVHEEVRDHIGTKGTVMNSFHLESTGDPFACVVVWETGKWSLVGYSSSEKIGRSSVVPLQ